MVIFVSSLVPGLRILVPMFVGADMIIEWIACDGGVNWCLCAIQQQRIVLRSRRIVLWWFIAAFISLYYPEHACFSAMALSVMISQGFPPFTPSCKYESGYELFLISISIEIVTNASTPFLLRFSICFTRQSLMKHTVTGGPLPGVKI
jgi:hypothetical protein